jgi:hypothetical protein
MSPRRTQDTDTTKPALLPKTSWIKIGVIPIAILYLYTGQRSVQDIISFLISLFAILSNMLAHTFMRHAQQAKTREHSNLTGLFASVCFAVSASVFLTLNLYASYHSKRYLFAQLVPQSINACLAVIRVFNRLSGLFDRSFTCKRVTRIIAFITRHPWIIRGRRIQKIIYAYFSQAVVYCLQIGHQYARELRQQRESCQRSKKIIIFTGQKTSIEIIESKIALVLEKYTPRRKFDRYFCPGDISRIAGVWLATLLLNAVDQSFNILSILFSVSLCTFAASQTIDRHNKPARADTYQLAHLYGSRLLALCSGILYVFDRKGLNATKNAAYAILNILVQKVISETRKREKS